MDCLKLESNKVKKAQKAFTFAQTMNLDQIILLKGNGH